MNTQTLQDLPSSSYTQQLQPKQFVWKRKVLKFPNFQKSTLPSIAKKDENLISKKDIDDVPTTIKISQSRGMIKTYSVNAFTKKLPESMKDSNFMEIFDAKVLICSEIVQCDSNSMSKACELKTNSLKEIQTFFLTDELQDLPQEKQIGVFNMLYKNLFDVVPRYPTLTESNFYQEFEEMPSKQ